MSLPTGVFLTPWMPRGHGTGKAWTVHSANGLTVAKEAWAVNAHLIAAAPDLYAALDEVMGWISNWSPNFTDDPEWQETQARADAARKKARGES